MDRDRAGERLMAKTDKNLGWPGFFRVFAVLCAIMLLLAQSGLL